MHLTKIKFTEIYKTDPLGIIQPKGYMAFSRSPVFKYMI
jgi:hypothetical protein